MTGRIKGCSVCCTYWPACLSPKRSEIHPHTWFAKRHKNKPTQKIYVCVLCLHYHWCCHENKPTQKKQSGRMTGWIKGCSVCCVCATAAAATKTNPLKKSLSLCCVCATTATATKTNPPKKKDDQCWVQEGYKDTIYQTKENGSFCKWSMPIQLRRQFFLNSKATLCLQNTYLTLGSVSGFLLLFLLLFSKFCGFESLEKFSNLIQFFGNLK
jgi:hypothetical protein